MVERDLREAFVSRRSLLGLCGDEIEMRIRECLGSIPHIDRISVRVKEAESFVRKASEQSDRYSVPLEEIEDQVGARVIVFFERDIERIAAKLREWFSPVEDFRHEPPRDAEFGYLTHHLVLVIPTNTKPDDWHEMDPMPTTFEVQLRTIFMHAYAEPQHELSYKNASDLSRDLERQLAWIAASAWGADRAYEHILESLGEDVAGVG